MLNSTKEEEVEEMQIQRTEKINNTVGDPNRDMLIITLNLMFQLWPLKFNNNQNVYKITNSNYKKVTPSLMLQNH